MSNLYNLARTGHTAKKPSLAIAGSENQLNQWPGFASTTSPFSPASLSGLNQNTAECSLMESLLLAGRHTYISRVTSTSIGHFQPQMGELDKTTSTLSQFQRGAALSKFSLGSLPWPGLEMSSQLPKATQSDAIPPDLNLLPRDSDFACRIARLREEMTSRSTLARAPTLSQTSSIALLRTSLQTRRDERLLESLQLQRNEEIARALNLTSQFMSSGRKRPFTSAMDHEPELSTAINGTANPTAPKKKPRLDQAILGTRLLPSRHQQCSPVPVSQKQFQPRPETTHPKSKLLSIPCDEEALTPYQCLARKQIELFAAETEDVEAKGRNRAIVKGQVGIRCRHCAHLPYFERAKGSTIYPSKLEGIYQAAQNMANSHLSKYCQSVPTKTRENLLSYGNKKSSAGGGKEYWSTGAKILNVAEDERRLYFQKKEV